MKRGALARALKGKSQISTFGALSGRKATDTLGFKSPLREDLASGHEEGRAIRALTFPSTGQSPLLGEEEPKGSNQIGTTDTLGFKSPLKRRFSKWP